MAGNQDYDDGLTDEERAALNEDDGDGTTDQDDGAAEAAAKAAQEQAEAEAAAAAEKAKQDADAAAAKAKEEADAAAVVPATDDQPAAPASQPILIAQAPEDAEAKLKEIGDKKEAILSQFDDGEITAREMQKQLDELARQERKIERDLHEAELSQKLEAQRLQNDWTATCHAFVESHPIYKNNDRLYRALDAEVRDLASKPDTAAWTGQRFLDEAHKNLLKAFGIQEQAAPAKAAPKQERDLPPNLAKVPAADVEDTNGGRFAVLDRLDGVALEAALSKMSEAERTAYLNA